MNHFHFSSFEQLQPLGLTPAMALHIARHGDLVDTDVPYTLARVTEVHRDAVTAHDGGTAYTARSRPQLLQRLQLDGTALAVGDWVFSSRLDDGSQWVEALVPPLTHIARRDGDGSRHAVASNVDTALLVMGLDLDFNPQRLERYLALAKGAGVQPVLVLTKADVLTASDGADTITNLMAQLRRRVGPALDMLAVDARASDTARALMPYAGPGQTLVLLGSSGTGKSTLTNTLLGDAVQDTGGVREHDSRGKHTTTSRSLHRLPGGACLIDTPGVRTLSPDVTPDLLDSLFDDVAALAPLCRFRDCRHQEEPGCAVREGVPPERLRNYHKLLREAGRDSQTPLQRRATLAMWKTLHREARQRTAQKQGRC
jgi:ribosome biogenesis GTPase